MLTDLASHPSPKAMSTIRGGWRFGRRLMDTFVGAPIAWRRKVDALRHDPEAPVAVGPWIDEVGYELLYWIPFLRRVFQDANIDPARVIAISRGGVDQWYAGIADRYVDILDVWEPDQLVHAHRERERRQGGGQRQQAVAPEDCRLVADIAGRLGLDRLRVVHPASMYRLLAGYLRGPRPASQLLKLGDHAPLRASYTRPAVLPIHGDYLVAKFYGSGTLPLNPENQAFVANLLARLAEAVPVLVLATGLELDDHVEFEVPARDGVHDARDLLGPARENLGRQCALVAHARGFVGTYGGFSYLPPMLGLPSIGVFSRTKFVPTHLATASIVLNRADAGGFAAVHRRTVAMMLDSLLEFTAKPQDSA
jgi:hypothetical protein